LTYGTGRSLLAITERGEGSSGNGAYDGLLSGALADWQLLAYFVEKLGLGAESVVASKTRPLRSAQDRRSPIG